MGTGLKWLEILRKYLKNNTLGNLFFILSHSRLLGSFFVRSVLFIQVFHVSF